MKIQINSAPSLFLEQLQEVLSERVITIDGVQFQFIQLNYLALKAKKVLFNADNELFLSEAPVYIPLETISEIIIG